MVLETDNDYITDDSDGAPITWTVIAMPHGTISNSKATAHVTQYNITIATSHYPNTNPWLYAHPDPGYKFIGYSDSQTSPNGLYSPRSTEYQPSPDATMNNYKLYAWFGVEYNLTVTKTGGGSGTVYYEFEDYQYGTHFTSGTVLGGERVRLNATADSNSVFVGWSDGRGWTSTQRSPTYTMPESNVTLTAHFEPKVCKITVVAGPGGMVKVGSGSTFALTMDANVNYNSNVNIVAQPSVGYEFDKWDDGNTNPSRTVTATGNATYTAYFKIITHKLYLNVAGSGKIDYSYSYGTTGAVVGTATANTSIDVPEGVTVSLVATGTGSSKFQYWSGDLQTAESVGSVNMGSADKTVTAHFGNAYALTIKIFGKGIVAYSYTVGSTEVKGSVSTDTTISVPTTGASNVTLTASGVESYHFVKWWDYPNAGNNTNSNPTISVNMSGDKSLLAEFSTGGGLLKVTINLVGADASNRLVTCKYEMGDMGLATTGFVNDGYITVPAGGSVTLTATTTSGSSYSFQFWSGGLQTAYWNETIHVYSDVTITAHFGLASDTCSLALNVNPNNAGTIKYTYYPNVAGSPTVTGTIDAAKTITVPKGLSVELSATGVSGYTFMYWTGDLSTGNSNGSITMDSSNKTATANFGSYTSTLLLGIAGGTGKITYTYNTMIGTPPSLSPWTVTGTVTTTTMLSVPNGVNIQLNAEGTDGNKFQYWSGDLHTAFHTESILIGNDDNKIAIANFGLNTKSLTIGFDGNGQVTYSYADGVTGTVSGTVSTTTVISVPQGVIVKLEATASSGVFTHWKVGDIGYTDNPYYETVTEDATVIAYFENTDGLVYITVATDGNGTVLWHYKHPVTKVTVSGGVGGYYVPKGADITFVAIAASTDKFLNWVIGSDGFAVNPYIRAISSPTTITAVFDATANTVTLTDSMTGNG
ncbi:MAG: hypothetical protein LBM39_02520 [Candidatus Methanoplasma sp.]|nr:hypothetical protein [Candidatus Methanoplasma sp.]